MFWGYPSVSSCRCTDEKQQSRRRQEAMSEAPLVAVAVDKDKGSQNALKWAVENLVGKGQNIILVHVNTKGDVDEATCLKEVLVPFRCFCTRKDVKCKNVVIQDSDIAKAIVEFVSQAAIEKLVVGIPSRTGFVRFKASDTPTNISRGAPDFCTVYVISKGKVSSMRSSVRAAPPTSAFRAQMQNQPSIKPSLPEQPRAQVVKGETLFDNRGMQEERDTIRSPFTRGGHNYNQKSYGEISLPDSDISFVSSGRPSIDRAFQPAQQRLSNASDGYDRSFEMARTSYKSSDSYTSGNEFSNFSQDSFSSQSMGEVEEEMKRLRLELKQTMDMYSTACKEALTAKQKAMELHRWKLEEEQRLQEARLAEEAALAIAEKERAKCKAAMEAAEASKRIAELEAQKRINAEKQALSDSKDRKSTMSHDFRYRRYSIEEIELATEYFTDKRKIGEGGYGPVYKCYLDHTPVAIKVLRPDAAQGRSQFQQEVEILSCIRHPNMVLLLGACPEYGCLVYEYMASGSLEDRLFRRGNSPYIPWQHRFRIAAEIATGLLFLHQTKPEPLVHRDLKPANILLDRNYVSKISDVGLARLVPPSVADNVTQYRMTSAAGTFCYIDPEYQQTGMLGIKSDIYSLGIMLLQLVTGKPPMGLTHHVERAIERGKFEEMLDPSVPDWPVEEALLLAKISLQCAELRRKDRPDLGTVVLPQLDRLRSLGEENMHHCKLPTTYSSPMASQVSMMDVKSAPVMVPSGYDTSRASTLSLGGR